MSAPSDQAHTRAEITDTLARIAYLADLGTVDEYLSHFTPGASWELQVSSGLPIAATTLSGTAAIRESVLARRAAGVQGPGSHTTHQVSATWIVQSGDTATASSLFLFYTRRGDRPELAGLGRYRDVFVWHAGRWLLDSRVVTSE